MKPKPKLAEGFREGWASYMSLHCLMGEGNGNPLQYSCLENPMDGGAGRLPSMGSLRVGYDWATSFSLFTFMHWRRKWQPSPVFLPGESQGWGSLVGCRLWVAKSRTRLKRLSSSSSHCLIYKMGINNSNELGWRSHNWPRGISRWPWESKWC